ncbi:MAG: CoA pyrophosphatase [Pseudomonadota bacterium]|nr:CoA pyrophosphatase [Pseudomonadota bacterium]
MSLAERLRRAFDSEPAMGPLTGDGDIPASTGAIAAAVLIAVTERPQPGVILTVRRDDMRTHAGQVAFPGGRIDPGEAAIDAAVREAWEEIGLEREQVKTVGALDDYGTITGYRVTPVVAVIPPDLALAPHEHEVADLFEAPLAFLLDPTKQRLESVLFEGKRRHYYQIDWNGRRIWGATAAMIVNLSRRLQWS